MIYLEERGYSKKVCSYCSYVYERDYRTPNLKLKKGDEDFMRFNIADCGLYGYSSKLIYACPKCGLLQIIVKAEEQKNEDNI